jgi:hypothetical protein
VRLDFAYNGGGSTGADPLADKFAQPAVNQAFGFINHTLDHPNLDCSTSQFITRQVADNLAWAKQRGLPVNPAELITGEHSGLANSRPGNPGTIDPPSIDDLEPAPGGTVPAGTYDYALTASSPAGETVASTVEGVAASGRVTASFDAVCHAVAYTLYRRAAGGSWAQVATLDRSATAPTDDGTNPIVLTLTDTGAAATPKAPPATNNAALAPYPQNPAFAPGIAAAGIAYTASDASKAYPPAAAGQTFFDGAVQAVPRYPSNVYYNASRQGQQLDEYNHIYVSPPGGACVPIANVTTCRSTPASWAEYVTSETRVMFRHLVDNDPRPHYVHQSNLADYNPALPETHPDQGGIAYPVFGALLDRYAAAYTTPLVQLTHTQIGQTLAQQARWAATTSVTGWLQDGKLHLKNAGTAPADVPLTGTSEGTLYGGEKSGWITLAAGEERVLGASDPTPPEAPAGTAWPEAPRAAPAEPTKPAAKKPARLQLTKVKLSPRRFAVAHRRKPKGTRLDGSRLSFRVNMTAKVRLSVQRKRGKRWVTVGSLTRSVKAGNGDIRFTGRFGRKLLKPRAYRLTVTASRSGQPRTAAKRFSFRVVKG